MSKKNLGPNYTTNPEYILDGEPFAVKGDLSCREKKGSCLGGGANEPKQDELCDPPEEEEEREKLICSYCGRDEDECEKNAESEKNPITQWLGGWGMSCDDCYYSNNADEDEDEDEDEDGEEKSI
jgi:hypothetical protein